MCQLHQQAKALLEQGIHLVSTDEMTGIQALERAQATLPMRPGKVERQEFEYIRHGTLSLIANWEIAQAWASRKNQVSWSQWRLVPLFYQIRVIAFALSTFPNTPLG